MTRFKLMTWSKDGGPESTVSGFFLIEWKRFFSIALLKFDNGSRDAYHDHAFNAVSWVLKGKLQEIMLDGPMRIHRPGWLPIVTRREDFHKVVSHGTTWVLSFRGPWAKEWHEFTRSYWTWTKEGTLALVRSTYTTLTDGRKKV